MTQTSTCLLAGIFAERIHRKQTLTSQKEISIIHTLSGSRQKQPLKSPHKGSRVDLLAYSFSRGLSRYPIQNESSNLHRSHLSIFIRIIAFLQDYHSGLHRHRHCTPFDPMKDHHRSTSSSRRPRRAAAVAASDKIRQLWAFEASQQESGPERNADLLIASQRSSQQSHSITHVEQTRTYEAYQPQFNSTYNPCKTCAGAHTTCDQTRPSCGACKETDSRTSCYYPPVLHRAFDSDRFPTEINVRMAFDSHGRGWRVPQAFNLDAPPFRLTDTVTPVDTQRGSQQTFHPSALDHRYSLTIAPTE